MAIGCLACFGGASQPIAFVCVEKRSGFIDVAAVADAIDCDHSNDAIDFINNPIVTHSELIETR
jgi:hypothetical protein